VRRGLRIAVGLLIVLIALAIVNAIVLDKQRRPAEANAPGGEILGLPSVDLQVIDQPATGPEAEGEPIVLLHALGASSRWWDEMVPILNENHRVIRIDLIGHGGSEKPTSGYEITTQAGAIALALNELEVQGATVVGHSLGGMVATSLAETASQLVDRVVLIATPAEPGSADLPFGARVSQVPVLGEAFWRVRLDAFVKKGYDKSFAPGFDAESAFEDPDRLVEDNRAMTFRSFADSVEAGDDFVDEQSIITRLGPTGVPVLAIEGAEDQIVDPEAGAASFEGLLGARVETLEDAGHSPNVELPEETAALVLEFAEAGVSTDVGPPPAKPPRTKGGKKQIQGKN